VIISTITSNTATLRFLIFFSSSSVGTMETTLFPSREQSNLHLFSFFFAA
jgi:hypothetical protein